MTPLERAEKLLGETSYSKPGVNLYMDDARALARDVVELTSENGDLRVKAAASAMIAAKLVSQLLQETDAWHAIAEELGFAHVPEQGSAVVDESSRIAFADWCRARKAHEQEQAVKVSELTERNRVLARQLDAARKLIERVCPHPHLTLDAKWRAEAQRLGCEL